MIDLPVTLVDVETVARYLSVTPDYVYRHADELGVRRLGTGSKSRLRFSLREVDELLRERSTCSSSRGSAGRESPETMPTRRPRRRRRKGTNPPLLPIRGRSAA
jgi:hypothetical protein